MLFKVMLVAALLSLASAETAMSGCVSSATECTCAEHPPSGVCTRPTVNGKCLDGECNDAMRCDCMGYEMCAINTCGKWEPVPPAVRSSTAEFQCTYDQNGSPCMTHTSFVDTVAGSENAKRGAVASVDEAIVDERESAVLLSTCVGYQTETLGALRNLREQPPNAKHNVTEEELASVKEEVDLTVAAVTKVTADVNEVVAQKGIAYGCEAEASALFKRAKEREEAAIAVEKEEESRAKEAEDKGEPCPTCDDIKAQIKAIRTERREAAQAAGTWAKKARDAKKNGKVARKNADENKLSAAEAKERCIAKSNQILEKLRGA